MNTFNAPASAWRSMLTKFAAAVLPAGGDQSMPNFIADQISLPSIRPTTVARPDVPVASHDDFVATLALKLGDATRRWFASDEAADNASNNEAVEKMDGLERAIEGSVASSLAGIVAEILIVTNNIAAAADDATTPDYREEVIGRSLLALRHSLPALADLAGVDLLDFGADYYFGDIWKRQARHRTPSGRAANIPAEPQTMLHAPDAELLALGRKFEAAWVEELAGGSLDDTAMVAEQIQSTSARTLDGLMVKARVLAWMADETGKVKVGNEDEFDCSIAGTIVRDLLTMGGTRP